MPKPKPGNAAALERRAQFLVSHLGFDPRESMTFRAGAPVATVSLDGTLAADPATALKMINASPYVREPLTVDAIYVHPGEVASTRYIADRFAFLSARTVANIADDCRRGIAFMTRHNTGGAFEGPGENPYGRTFAGTVEKVGGITRAVAQFYMLRAHSPNGPNAASTDDVHRSLIGGTLFDFSTGLTRGGLDLRTCDICGNEIFSLACGHCPGSIMGMTAEEIAAQAARGVPDGKATFTFDDWHSGEISGVYNGAIPFSGTAFAAGRQRVLPLTLATDTESEGECSCCSDDSIDCGCSTKDQNAAGECACHADCPDCKSQDCSGSTDMSAQEEPMYTPARKLQLGLAATATDAEVDAAIDAKLAHAATLSTDNASLLAEKKTAADAAFTAAWTEKLGADTVASLMALPNRDDLAKNFASKLATMTAAPPAPAAPPPIGNPLAGAGLAAAPPAASVGTKESEDVRKGLGTFASNAEVEKYALTSPLKALAGVLGLKNFAASGAHIAEDESIIANRKTSFGITG